MFKHKLKRNVLTGLPEAVEADPLSLGKILQCLKALCGTGKCISFLKFILYEVL